MKKAAVRAASAAINFCLFFVSFYFMAIPLGISDYWERYPIYIPEFIMCTAFIVIAFAVPFAANFLLYRFWYKRAGISKLWIIIPLLCIYLALGFWLIVFFMTVHDCGTFTWQYIAILTIYSYNL